MTGELIDLDQARREHWVAKVRRMRELGEVGIFGAIGTQNAQILQFPAILAVEADAPNPNQQEESHGQES